MRNLTGLSILVVFLVGCANFLTTTATSGTSFGMSKKSVIRVLERKGYKIIDSDENTIVVEGIQEQLRQPAIKTFTFENDKLVSVSDKVLGGNVNGSTLNFMK